jgi:hypothetical protein
MRKKQFAFGRKKSVKENNIRFRRKSSDTLSICLQRGGKLFIWFSKIAENNFVLLKSFEDDSIVARQYRWFRLLNADIMEIYADIKTDFSKCLENNFRNAFCYGKIL